MVLTTATLRNPRYRGTTEIYPIQTVRRYKHGKPGIYARPEHMKTMGRRVHIQDITLLVTLLAKVSGPQYYWKFFPPERASQHLRDCHARHGRNCLATLSSIPVPQIHIFFIDASSETKIVLRLIPNLSNPWMARMAHQACVMGAV